MTRVLFVDDEPRILDGLRRMLRSQRGVWDMVFAPGGEAALEEVSAGAFDVVITDMRMPGIDGVELLTRVQQLHPHTLRLVLSGHTDPTGAARAACVAHQFISKPSSPDTVRAVVDRVIARARSIPRDIRSLVGGIGAFPVDARSYERLVGALADADPDLDDLTEIVVQEPGMAAKLLQVVNSSFFGISPQVSDIKTAVRLLTPGPLRELVLSAGTFHPLGGEDGAGTLWGEVRAHSACVANVVAAEFEADPHTGYTAGLLHDIGKLVLREALGTRYASVASAAREEGVPLHVAEQAALGTTHARVGAYLLGIWNLPDVVVETVAAHAGVDGECEAGALAMEIRLAHAA